MSLLALINDKRDLARYRVDPVLHFCRPSKWSRCPSALRDGSLIRVYKKLEREPDLERVENRGLEYMKRKYDIREPIETEPRAAQPVVPPRFKCEPKLSPEEAEKISSEIIQSFARNRDMKELLEGAKFFAGASALAGVPEERRARRKVSFSV